MPRGLLVLLEFAASRSSREELYPRRFKDSYAGNNRRIKQIYGRREHNRSRI